MTSISSLTDEIIQAARRLSAAEMNGRSPVEVARKIEASLEQLTRELCTNIHYVGLQRRLRSAAVETTLPSAIGQPGEKTVFIVRGPRIEFGLVAPRTDRAAGWSEAQDFVRLARKIEARNPGTNGADVLHDAYEQTLFALRACFGMAKGED
jgi:hypothetical protein